MFDISYAEYLRKYKGQNFARRANSTSNPTHVVLSSIPKSNFRAGLADKVELTEIGIDFVMLTWLDSDYVEHVPLNLLRVLVRKENA